MPTPDEIAALRAKAEQAMAEDEATQKSPTATDGQKNEAHAVAVEAMRVAAEAAGQAQQKAAQPADPMTASAPGKKRVRILKPCSVNWNDPNQPMRPTSEFSPRGSNVGIPGVYELDEADAAHWYLRAHSDDPPPTELVPGTAAYIDAMKRTLANQKLLDLADEQAATAAALEARGKRRRKLQEDASPGSQVA